MDLFTVFVWIIFYLVVVTLFYYCFRQSMSSVQQSARARTNSASRTTPTTYSSASGNPRTANERRTAIRSGHNRSVFVITDESDDRRPSDALDIRSPPEYKWEDLPPSYEEAVGSFTNPTFNDQQQQQSSPSVVGDSTVIEVPASAASVN